MGCFLRTKISILLVVLLLLFSSSGIMVEGSFKIGVNPNNQVIIKDIGSAIKISRKILGLDASLDYDDAGPNPKHDPRKGKPGPGGKNL